MVINVSPEIEKKLIELAGRIGAPPEDYAGFLLEKKLHVEEFVNGNAGIKHEGEGQASDALAQYIAKMKNRTPEEVEQTRARTLGTSRPPLHDMLTEEEARNLMAHSDEEDEEDEDHEDHEALKKAISDFLNRTPEEMEQARERLLKVSRPPRPLPEGQTLLDAVCGKWPGDETDEEVFEALRRLS